MMDDVAIFAAQQHKVPVLALPPTAAQHTRQFLPHHLPKARSMSPPPPTVSWESATIRSQLHQQQQPGSGLTASASSSALMSIDNAAAVASVS